ITNNQRYPLSSQRRKNTSYHPATLLDISITLLCPAHTELQPSSDAISRVRAIISAPYTFRRMRWSEASNPHFRRSSKSACGNQWASPMDPCCSRTLLAYQCSTSSPSSASSSPFSKSQHHIWPVAVRPVFQ